MVGGGQLSAIGAVHLARMLGTTMNLWRGLTEELDRWSDADRCATFWWRDDDAVAPTPELEALLRCAQTVPVALSVIPCVSTRELAARLRGLSSVVVLQHGWDHTNHANAGKSEYPPCRSAAEVAWELKTGAAVLAERFGAQTLRVFVPPWHSFDDRFLAVLPLNGISHLSRKGPRSRVLAAPGLRQVNVHVAPVRWTAQPSFTEADGDDCLLTIIDHLAGRRTSRYDPLEPTGLLTHHLVQNGRSYGWMSRLISVTSQHPAGRWLAARDVFRTGPDLDLTPIARTETTGTA